MALITVVFLRAILAHLDINLPIWWWLLIIWAALYDLAYMNRE